MANGKEAYTSQGDKVKVTKTLKEIGNLNSTAKKLMDAIKAFPISRDQKNKDTLAELRKEIDDTIDRETGRFISNGSAVDGHSLAMFLNGIFSKSPKADKDVVRGLMQNQSLDDLMNDQNAQLNLILSERYKNVNSLYEDIRLVTEQLAELAEVIDTFRDAIVNSDNIIADISRTLKFDNHRSDNSVESKNLMSTVETMEENTRIKEKLKKIIIPEVLKYGNIFVFVQPYKDLFAKFKALDDKFRLTSPVGTSGSIYRVHEAYTPTTEDMHDIDALYESFQADFDQSNLGKKQSEKITKESFEELVNQYVQENIAVVNDPLVPLLEDSDISTLAYPDVRSAVAKAINTKKKDKNWKPVQSSDVPKYTDGVLNMSNASDKTLNGEEKYLKEFNDVTGVFMKIYDPRRVIPIYVMDYCIGYYLLYETVQETTSNVLNAVHTLSRTTMLFQNDKKREFESRFIGLIADRICRSIDKPFLKKNKAFKELIANAIAYDNFYTKNFRVQFVTSNYITHFKVNENYNTHMGTSVLYRSMFYAMLYLTMLLFYILMYVTRTGDTRMFLIKSNGSDKDISGKMNRIIKEFKQKQINYNDFGSVRGILAKVGQGKDIGVPVGMNGDKAFDIEQLSGSSIDFNDPLIELLRKGMISNTGCPSAMLNYLDEVDFAKQIQMLHSKFVARCVSMQQETEGAITDLYKKLLSYGDYNIGEEDLDNFKFEWARPRSLNTSNLNDVISSSDQMAEFMIKVLVGDNSVDDPRLKDRVFGHLITKYLMNGVFDWDAIKKEFEQLRLDLSTDIHAEDVSKINTEESGE